MSDISTTYKLCFICVHIPECERKYVNFVRTSMATVATDHHIKEHWSVRCELFFVRCHFTIWQMRWKCLSRRISHVFLHSRVYTIQLCFFFFYFAFNCVFLSFYLSFIHLFIHSFIHSLAQPFRIQSTLINLKSTNHYRISYMYAVPWFVSAGVSFW